MKAGKDYLNPAVKHFSEDEGLPFGYTRVFSIGEKEVFWVKRNELPEQNYLFDEANSKFIEYTGFASYLGLRDALAYPISQENRQHVLGEGGKIRCHQSVHCKPKSRWQIRFSKY